VRFLKRGSPTRFPALRRWWRQPCPYCPVARKLRSKVRAQHQITTTKRPTQIRKAIQSRATQIITTEENTRASQPVDSNYWQFAGAEHLWNIPSTSISLYTYPNSMMYKTYPARTTYRSRIPVKLAKRMKRNVGRFVD
jgi:hypothetical protein